MRTLDILVVLVANKGTVPGHVTPLIACLTLNDSSGIRERVHRSSKSRLVVRTFLSLARSSASLGQSACRRR